MVFIDRDKSLSASANREAQLSDLFQHFRKRPVMYTGETSLVAIDRFLAGYSLAADIYGVGEPADRLLIPREFHDWVAYRLHFFEGTSGWCSMILERAASEAEAIERFFLLLDEFYARKAHVVARLVGLDRTYSRQHIRRENESVIEGPMETLPYPKSIAIVTYTDDPGFFAYSETPESFPHKGFFPKMEWFETCTGAKREMLTIIDPSWKP